MNNRFRALVESLVYCLCFSIVWIAVAPLSEGIAATTPVDPAPLAPLSDDMLFAKTIALYDVTRMNAVLDIGYVQGSKLHCEMLDSSVLQVLSGELW